ncbi:MAG: hypothetical protein ACE5IR_17475 [bacterium]
MSNPHTFSRPVFLFSYLLAGALSTVSPVAASDGAISYAGGSMIFLKPDLRRQPDAYAIELSEPIVRSPVVVSFYSVLGTKVFEHTLALETPTHTIALGDLCDNLARLPSGIYFYDVHTSGAAVHTQVRPFAVPRHFR